MAQTSYLRRQLQSYESFLNRQQPSCMGESFVEHRADCPSRLTSLPLTTHKAAMAMGLAAETSGAELPQINASREECIS